MDFLLYLSIAFLPLQKWYVFLSFPVSLSMKISLDLFRSLQLPFITGLPSSLLICLFTVVSSTSYVEIFSSYHPDPAVSPTAGPHLGVWHPHLDSGAGRVPQGQGAGLPGGAEAGFCRCLPLPCFSCSHTCLIIKARALGSWIFNCIYFYSLNYGSNITKI